jgi:hypothetical protein
MKYIIKESQYVYLFENLDKRKRLFIDLLGEDLINSIQEVTSSKELPIGFLKHFGTSTIQSYIDAYGPLYYFVLDGEKFVYKDRISPKGEEYEMYINDKGKSFVDGEITDRLGLSDMGLKFSDVIDAFHNEGEPLNESTDKNKKFLTNVMGHDFTGKIEQVTSTYDVPMEFDNNISPAAINYYLNKFGPMYLFELDGIKYLYHDHDYVDFFIDENGFYYNDEILEQLGIDELGLRFSDIIDLYFNEEETLNEGIDMSQNVKVKKLLQNLYENKDFNVSFEDEEYVYALGADYEELVYTPYEFKFHMIVKKVYGEGSNTIAKIDVIIDDIQKDNEDFYDEWVSDGYNEDVWYIEELGDKIKQELLEDLPFSIYLTFYGYDE